MFPKYIKLMVPTKSVVCYSKLFSKEKDKEQPSENVEPEHVLAFHIMVIFLSLLNVSCLIKELHHYEPI